jgi:hypothetical protein
VADHAEHGPAEHAGGLSGGEAGTVIERLTAESDHIHATDLIYGGCQDARGALRVERSQGRVGNEDRVIGAHGQGMFERFLAGFRSNAQCGDGAAVGFLLLERALHGIFIEWVDDERRISPRDLPA